MTENSVRGAGTARAGATDTTMLIWKVIAAQPGITRAEIWDRVEHSIPEGYAIRRYIAYRETSGSGGLSGGGRILDASRVLPAAARRYVLTHSLRSLRTRGKVTWEDSGNDRRYTAIEPPKYLGNADAIDETGTKAAEHMATVEALRVVEKMLARANLDTKHGPLVYLRRNEYQAVALLAKTLRAQGSAIPEGK